MSTNITASTQDALTEILSPYLRVESAALYGSVARGDSEPHSDIDLLVVCNDECEEDLYAKLMGHLSKHFDKLSLCVYTHRELRFLVKAQSLFLLHLKEEALLLFDRSGFLRETLSSFERRASYEADFCKSLELISPLRTVVLGASNQVHRLAYIYSLFRVFGVYLLAGRGIFEFSKARMSAALSECRPNQANNIHLLSELRVLNANFFSGGVSVEDSGDRANGCSLLQASTRALGELVERPLVPIECCYGAAVGDFVNACSETSRPLDFRLRSWFLLLVYDGLNLYCDGHERCSLTSFSEPALSRLLEPALPKPVRAAVDQSLNYLQNYHRKYSFAEEHGIRADQACSILRDLAAVS